MERKATNATLSKFTLLLLALLPSSLAAHPVHPHSTSFGDGLVHGVTSGSHLFLALAVGFLCHMTLQSYKHGWGKLLGLFTVGYAASHATQFTGNTGTLAGLALGFVCLSSLGAALSQLTSDTKKLEGIKQAISVAVVIGLIAVA